MRRASLMVLLAIGLMFVATRSAHASQITMNFTATVFGSNVTGISTGNIVTGSFTYETAGVDSDPDPSHRLILGNFTSFAAATGAFNLQWSSFNPLASYAETLNDAPTGAQFEDVFDLVGINASVTSSNVVGVTPFGASVTLVRFGAAPPVPPLSSEALPSLLILSDWSGATVGFSVIEGDDRNNVHNVLADLTSLSPAAAAVPEPGTLSLLGLGLVGVAKALRRRKSASS